MRGHVAVTTYWGSDAAGYVGGLAPVGRAERINFVLTCEAIAFAGGLVSSRSTDGGDLGGRSEPGCACRSLSLALRGRRRRFTYRRSMKRGKILDAFADQALTRIWRPHRQSNGSQHQNGQIGGDVYSWPSQRSDEHRRPLMENKQVLEAAQAGDRLFLDDAQVCERYSIARSTLRNWCAAGTFPAPVRFHGYTKRWCVAELNAHDHRLIEARDQAVAQ